MKEIFVGSSNEGLEQAKQVAAIFSEAPDVKPLVDSAGWSNSPKSCFPPVYLRSVVSHKH